MPPEQNKITILFLAANPVDQKQLAIDEEMRAIDDALMSAKFGDRFDLRSAWAVRYGNLQKLLLHYEPHIVHFSAHGSEAGELLLTGTGHQSYAVPPEKLAELFDILKDNVRCVVLNACFSEEQAQGIAASIDCVVGMTRAVQDSDAIEFAIGFYLGIGFGRSVQTAFSLGRNRIPSTDGQQVASLVVRSGVDPAQLILTPRVESDGVQPSLRAQVKDLLILFERAAFRPYDGKNAGDPTAAFNAIQDTRIALQKRGAALIDDKHLADQFRSIQNMLLNLEQSVNAEYPLVVQLAAKWKGKPLGTSERLAEVKHELGAKQYDDAAMFIRSEAADAYFAAERIRERLLALSI